MTPEKTNKERVNITVDPDVHQRLIQHADRSNQSISGIINSMMAIYCGLPKDTPAGRQVSERLRLMLLQEERDIFQRIVQKIVREMGFAPLDVDDADPANIIQIPENRVSEWVGNIGKAKVGVKLALNLEREPDLTLGKALMLRGLLKCERLILVVPYLAAIPEAVLAVVGQAGMEVVGTDLLETVLRSRPRKETEPTEGRLRVREAQSELYRMRKKRQERESEPALKKTAKA